MVWVKLCLDKLKPIHVCSFYRPPNTSMDPIIEFKHLLSDIFTHNSESPRIILAGDFNLPDIYIRRKDWGILIQVQFMDMSLTHYL